MRNSTRRKPSGTHNRYSVAIAFALTMLLSACSADSTADNDGPWLGEWVQVNFLSTDDNGVWDNDILSGIGFVASVDETEWTETDDDGDGCSITMSYSIDGSDKFSRQATRAGSKCPSIPLALLKDTGRLEFGSDDNTMIQWFDLQPGDDITAFKWVRR